MKKILLLSVCMLVLMVSFVGCKEKAEVNTDPTQQAPAVNAKVKAPDIIGEVLEVKEDGKLILIDSKDAMVTGKVWVTINDETSFFENISKDIAIGYRDVSRVFVVGNHVEVITNGTILESEPAQATATAIAVNEKK